MRISLVILLFSLVAASAGAPRAPASDEPEVAAAVPAPAITSLRADLEQLLAAPRWSRSQWGVLVLSLDRGDTLYAHGGDELLAPASNIKLFTTAAALNYLGPQFRYNTFLLGTGPVENGLLRGDLVVYGTGDPTLSDRFGARLSVWQAFTDSLRALGIREVEGGVVGDGSYFDGPGVGEGWKNDYLNAYYAAPAGALSYAENLATIEIRPAGRAGQPPSVRLVRGGSEGVEIVNQAVTAATGRSTLSVTRAAYDGPITIRGRVRRGTGSLLRSVPVPDPARYAAAAFKEILESGGITVRGGVRSALTAEDSPVTGRSVFAPAYDSERPLRVLALHNSPPLIEILEVVNKRSHNLMAEQVLRTVARVATGSGTVAGGARAVTHLLEQAVPATPPALSMYDGSGLSPLNRVSARTTVHLLSYMASSPMWDSYWQTLPEAGAPDGLRRMYRTPAQGNLRAKTGTISHVSALSGYVRAADGERLAFAILANDVPSTAEAKRVEDAIGARLSQFDRHGEVARPQPPATSVESRSTATPAARPRTYIVRRGDTLSEIARRHGTTVTALRRANPKVDARRLLVGTRLRLPQ